MGKSLVKGNGENHNILQEIIVLEDDGDLQQEVLHCKFFMKMSDLCDNRDLCIGPSFLDRGCRRKRHKDYRDLNNVLIITCYLTFVNNVLLLTRSTSRLV